MTVVAHLGHWYASLLYVAPVLAVIAGLAWQSRRDHGEDDLEDDEESVDEPGRTV